jgi:hypothetical protein
VNVYIYTTEFPRSFQAARKRGLDGVLSTCGLLALIEGSS